MLPLWNTDDRLPKIFLNKNEASVCIAIRKNESRNGDVSRMTMHAFLKRYIKMKNFIWLKIIFYVLFAGVTV